MIVDNQYLKYNNLYTIVLEYNEFKFLCELLQDKEESNNIFWYVQPKTTEVKSGTRVISNKFSPDPYYSLSLRRPINDNERQVFNMFNKGKVCFSDNLTGTEFNNIINHMM